MRKSRANAGNTCMVRRTFNENQKPKTGEQRMIEDKNALAKSIIGKFKKAGADDVIVDINDDLSSQIKFANSKIAVTQTWSTAKADLFVAVKKRLVATTIKDFSDASVLDTISRIMKFTEKSTPNEDYEGIAEGPFKYKEIEDIYDKNVENLDEKAVDMAQAALNAAE